MEKTLWEGKFEEGKAEGRAEEKAAGIVEGEAQMLLQYIKLKFGAIPEELEKRIRLMDAKRLLALSHQVFNAQAIDDIAAAIGK
jgi:methylphosphotriester-DNA--protein-cysteine methyltransferase